MLSLALAGGVGCILAYGQTGSGKTYTMESVEHRVARDLFDQAKVVGKRLLLAQGGDPATAETGDIFEFNVTFLELLGKHASDLLEETKEVDAQGNPVRTEISVREDKVRIPFHLNLGLIDLICKGGECATKPHLFDCPYICGAGRADH
jgi:kinesin family protein 2/24